MRYNLRSMAYAGAMMVLQRAGHVAELGLGERRLGPVFQHLDQRFVSSERARRHLARLCRLTGNCATAATLLEAQLAAQLAVPSVRRRRPARRSKPMNPDAARAALAAVLARLGNVGVTPFLAFGTLLGAMREGRFVGHDHDIDLGVFADEVSALDLRRLFRPFLEVTLDWSSRLSPRPDIVKVRHRSGIIVDLVLFERRPSAFITRVRYQRLVLERHRRPFGLRPMDFLGLEVMVPDPPEAFLDENYGDWRIPDPHYHFVVSSRMPVDPEAPLFRYFVFSGLVDAMSHGEVDRLRSLARRALERGLVSDVVERAATFEASVP